LNTGALPFKEYSKEWLHQGEISSSSLFETVTGGTVIRKLLGEEGKRMSCWKKRGGKEKIDRRLYLI
jgi:hypothetical protein